MKKDVKYKSNDWLEPRKPKLLKFLKPPYPRSARGVNQITTLWNDPKSRKHLMQIFCNTQLRDCPKSRTILMSKLNTLVLGNPNARDVNVYQEIRKLIQDHIMKSQEWRLKTSLNPLEPPPTYRTEHRLERLIKILKKTVPKQSRQIQQILDIGCADGTITAKIGKHFKLPISNIHGCDVVDQAGSNPTFTHTLIKEGDRLPYETDSMDLVIALMSLHHVRHLDCMLKDISRVLKPGGLLFIREHNVTSTRVEAILDVVHGFYELVWATRCKHCDFSNYFIKYRSAEQWTEKLRAFKFKEIYNDSKDERYWKLRRFDDRIPNPLRYYYGLYKN